MVFFTTRYSSNNDLNMYPHIVVTSDTPWDPHGLVMPGGLGDTDDIDNDRMTQQVTLNTFRNNNRHHQMYESDRISFSINGNMEQLIIDRMISSAHISSIRHMEQLQSKTRHSQFGPEHVAAIFGVGLGTAKDILCCYAQQSDPRPSDGQTPNTAKDPAMHLARSRPPPVVIN